MSSAGNMDALRKRYIEGKQAEEARNTLIDELFQKIDDMQKTMDRNAFIMVLIDGDCMNFLNELVKRGAAGGDEAAKLLKRAVFEYLRHDDDFKHDHEIVIRVYANLRGLSKTYVDKGILPNTAAFFEFVLGFNKAHPLCDFIDAGNHKEAADTKLKENFSLYVYNVHCRQIIFGGSADNGYASFLSSLLIDTDVSSRIRILKGPPFSIEFRSILAKLRWTEFPSVFRSDAISKELVPSRVRPRSQEFEPPHKQEPRSRTATDDSPMPVSEDLAILSKNKQPKANYNGVGDGMDVSDELRYDPSISLPTSSSPTSSSILPRARVGLTAADIEAALMSCTYQRLQQSPKAIDFGVVKQRVEQILDLPPDFWGKNEKDEWFLKSKNIIKMAVEDWVERTNNPPPKNATWMFNHFPSRQESPSSNMKGQYHLPAANS